MRLLVTLGVAAAAAATTATAYAADAFQRARLVYAVEASAEAACPDAAVLRSEVAKRLGYNPFWEWAPRTIVVQVRRGPEGYVARIVNVDPTGVSTTRDVPADAACGEVVGAAALDIAIALDMTPPNALPPHATPEPAPSAPPTAPGPDGFGASTPPPAEPEQATHRAVALPPPWLAIGGGAAAFTGFTPKPGLTALAFAELRRLPASLAVELSFSVSPPAENLMAMLASAAVVPCLRYGPALGCGLAQIGWLEASGTAPFANESDGAPFVAIGVRAGVELPLSDRAFLRLRSDVLVEVFGPRFTVESTYTASPKRFPAPAVALFSSTLGGALGVDAGAYFR